MQRHSLLALPLYILMYLSTYNSEKVTLNIGAIYPLTQTFSSWGQGCLPAAQMAIEDINARQNILEDYELHLINRDSQGSPGRGMREFFRLIQLNRTIIMMLGPFPSHIAQAVAETAKWWNLITVSPAAFTPELSDRARYPYFFRTRAALSTFNGARLALMREFGWNRAAILTRNQNYFIHTADLLNKAMEEGNITVVTTEVFQNNADPLQEIKRIKKLNARIIFLLVYEEYARKVFCQAYKQGVYGPKYVWILHFGNDPWWMNKSTADGACSAEQIQQAASYHLIISDITLREDNATAYSKYTTTDFIENYKQKAKAMNFKPSVFYAPLTYDAVWAMALTLNASRKLLKQGQRLEGFTYEDSSMAKLFTAQMEKLEFDGLTGPVAFSSTGDISTLKTKFRQYRDGQFFDIGVHDAQTDQIHMNGEIKWQGGTVPPDDLLSIDYPLTIPIAALVVTSVIAATGIAFSGFLLWFNIHKRSLKIIRMSSPNLNNFIIVGCVLGYISVALYGIDRNTVGSRGLIVACKARMIIFAIGFSLLFGALFAKTWRVYIIFTNQSQKRVEISDFKLIGIMSTMVAVDIFIFLLWFLLDPPFISEYRDSQVPAPNGQDFLLTPVIEVCYSKYQPIWTGALYGIKGVLLLFGVFLVVQTRNVSIPVLNDSKYIGFAVYNVLTMCLLGVPMTFILAPSQLVALYIIIAICITVSVTVTQCLVFLPKLYAVKMNKIDDLTTTNFNQSVNASEIASRVSIGLVQCNSCGAAMELTNQSRT